MPRLLPALAAAFVAVLPLSLATADTAERADLWGRAVAGSSGHATQLERLAAARAADRSPARDLDRAYERGLSDGFDRATDRGIVRYRSPRPTVVISGTSRFGDDFGLEHRVRSTADLRLSQRQRVLYGGGHDDRDVIVRGGTSGVFLTPRSSTRGDRFFDRGVTFREVTPCPTSRFDVRSRGGSSFDRGFDRGFRSGFDTGSRSGFRSRGFDRGGASIELRFGDH